jgi:hypothetical protein
MLNALEMVGVVGKACAKLMELTVTWRVQFVDGLLQSVQ